MPRGIVRKRKRSAVDPCLGYYAEKGSGATQGLSVGAALDRDRCSVFTLDAARTTPDQALKSPENESSTFRKTGYSTATDSDAHISVEGFLRGRAAPSVCREEPWIGAGNLQMFKHSEVGLGYFGDRSSPRYATPKFSPIEFEVSPLCPKPAVAWAFDIKVPNSTGTLPGEDAYDELQSDNDSLPEIAVLECDSSPEGLCPPPSDLRNKGTVCLRSRSIRRRRLVEDLDHESEDCDTDSDYENSTPPIKIFHKKKAKNVKFKSLGSRLFDACVATHGNPLDSLVVPPPNHAVDTETLQNDRVRAQRKPLSFNPIDSPRNIPDSGLTTVPKKHTLVDPRRLEPLRTAQFGPPMKPHRSIASQGDAHAIRQPPIVYKTLSNWRPKLDENCFQEVPSQDQFRGQRKSGHRKEGQAIPEIAYPALEFVPLSEAQPRGKNRNGHQVPLENRRV